MHSGRPTVSVVVTTKNSDRTLARCLQSIREQSHQPIELIVVDNHSTDETAEIGKLYADKFLQAGPERCAQRNIGVQHSLGAYVLIVDSDMYLHVDVVNRCLAAMNDGHAGVIIPEESVGRGFWAKCKAFERDFYRNDSVIGAARFFPKDVYVRAGGFDESLVSGEDWDLSIRVEQIGQVAIADTLIQHDEGSLQIGTLMKKKFYYGSHIRKFVEKNGAAAISRLNPMRTSYGQLAGRFAQQPVIAAGMIAMRLCEMSAGAAGLLYSYVRPGHR